MYRFSTALILSLFCLLLAAFQAPAGEKLWVSSENAKLKAERSSSSETISLLPLGTELDVLVYEKRWYQVSTPTDSRGWIYRGRVSKTPVEARESAGIGEEDTLGGLLSGLAGGDVQDNASDASRSIRGLSPEAEQYAKRSGTAKKYRQILDEILTRKVSQEEMEQFLQAGKIGEYAE